MNYSLKNTHIQFQGYLKGDKIEKIPILLEIESSRYDAKNIKFDMILLVDDREYEEDVNEVLIKSMKKELIIYKNSSDFIVSTDQLVSWEWEGLRVKLNILSYQCGISDKLLSDKHKIIVTVELVPGHILSKTLSRIGHLNGNVEHTLFYTDNIEWSIDYGKAIATVHYEIEDDRIYQNEAMIQICRPRLQFFDIQSSGKTTSAQLKETIIKEVEDVCLMLSLCYRRFVEWYEIRFIIYDDENSSNQIPYPVRVHKKMFDRIYPDKSNILIFHQELRGDNFNNLIKSYRNSEYKNAIRQAIVYIVASYSKNDIETDFTIAYTALESLCENLFKSDKVTEYLSSSKFQKLEKELKRLLKEFGEKESLNGEIIEKIKKKLPELKRISADDKIIHCCNRLDIKNSDLWKKEGFESGIRSTIKLRNLLLHQAVCSDYNELILNTIRVRILTERLILRLLNWPDDKLWRLYDQNLP